MTNILRGEFATVREWEKSVWKKQFFFDYEKFIGATILLKDHLETGEGMSPHKADWWKELEGLVNQVMHTQRVLEVTRRRFVESNPLEENIPFGHFPVEK